MTEPDSPDTAPDNPDSVPPAETVPVVGIVASAGGLEAIRRFLAALPTDPEIAFVVVTHLDPTHESVLHEILQQYTEMPVRQVNERLKVEPNHVYVISPAQRIVLTGTHLDTAAFEEPRGQRGPVDLFFRSLAEAHHDAIAIVLSGSGTDGEVLKAANKEYRSTIEALETRNEELQAVNNELKHKLEEVSRAQRDLENLMAATEIATLFLDRDLRIQRYTPGVSDLFHIRPGDRGRPIADVTRHIVYPELETDARQVLRTLVLVEREVPGPGEKYFLVRSRPYHSLEERLEGVVITFVDITAPKQTEKELHAAKEYAESIIQTLHEPLLVLTPDLRVRSANPAFFAHFQVQPSETTGRLIYELGNYQWDIPELRTLLEEVLPDSSVFNDYEVAHNFEQIGERVMLLNARRLDSVRLILLGIRDITERTRAEEALRANEEQLRRMVNVEGVGVLLCDESGTLLDANDAFLDMHGYSREEVESGTMTWRDLTPPEYVAESEGQMEKLARTGRIGPYEKEYLRKDGSRAWMLFAGASLDDGVRVKYCIDVSDRKHAEDALRESEARFRELTNTLPALVWTTDPHGRPTYFNEGWLAYTGQSEDEAFRVGTVRAIHPDDYERARARWREADAAEETFEIEYRLRRSDGKYERHVARAVPVRSADGAVTEWVGSAINVQAQREAEAAVQASEERYRVLVESAREYAILLLDASGQITMWSKGAERIFGYTEAEALGQHSALIFTEQDRAEGVPEREITVAAETGMADDERWHRRKDGTRFWASGVLQALHDDAGQLRGFTKVLRDNTVRKQAEDALRQSEERFRQLVEAVPDIVFTATPDGVIDYVSPRRREMTGQPEENALGTRMWSDLIHPHDRSHAMSGWEKAIVQQQPCVLRYRLKMADGSYRWVITRARPVLDRNNEVYRWFGTVSDVDALTRAEGELRRLNETLEERVTTRTAQVEELAIALTLAEQGERQRVSQVLHDDLQQLLYSQLMRLQMAHDQGPGPDEERISSTLEQIMQELKQAIEVTRTLVTELSPPVLQTEGLPEALTWLSAYMNQMYGLNVAVKIRARCEPPSPAMRALLVQMTRELLFNVVKHAGTQQAELILERDGQDLHLAIQDRGSGFDAAATLAARSGRRGFGLTSVIERLELLGGRVEIVSMPGKGTQITLIAPCHDEKETRQGEV